MEMASVGMKNFDFLTKKRARECFFKDNAKNSDEKDKN